MESISDNGLFEQAVQVCTMGCVSMALKAAIELDIVNIIASARLSAAEIVGQLPSKNPGESAVMLNRVLQLLAGPSILTCVVDDGQERRYGLAILSKFLVGSEDDGSLAPLSCAMTESKWKAGKLLYTILLSNITLVVGNFFPPISTLLPLLIKVES